MSALTPRQAQILAFIESYQAEHQVPPTQAEITQAMGFRSRTASKDHLRALEKKGVLSLTPNSSRGIRLLKTEEDTIYGLPLVGKVAAGQPILALENIQSHHRVDPALFRPRADYLLQVQGQSMQDIGIYDGDWLAVHQTPEAQNGQIVVARVDDEVTVKRFQRRGHMVSLLPENSEFQPLEIDLRQSEFSIEGLMVGLIRHQET